MTKPKDIDWNAVELDYRAGIKTLAVISKEFGVSDAGILKKAKREGWTRDLKSRIRAETEKKLAELVSPEKLVREELVIQANADTQVGIVVSQRKDIKKARDLGGKLFAELEAMTDSRELFDQLVEMLESKLEADFGEKAAEKMMDAFRKASSLPGRVSTYKQLTDAIKTMVGLERQSYGLSDNANGDSDKPAEKAEMSPQEEARRIAFVLASAMHNKGE